jgi:nuclease HARBI1
VCVWGPSLYAQTRYVMRGFKGSMSHLQQIFSQRMNALRISVEWGFGKVLNDWPYLTQKMAHKLGVSPVGLVYWCAVLLSNVNQVSAVWWLSVNVMVGALPQPSSLMCPHPRPALI